MAKHERKAPQGVIDKWTVDAKTGAIIAEVNQAPPGRSGPPSTVRLVRRIARSAPKAARTIKESEVRRLRRSNRGALSGQSKTIGVRLKDDAVAQIERRAQELGVSVSEYVRLLIYSDLGVVA